jgi:hypothetical protein
VGPVFVLGNVVVTGSKSAAVAHPDGTHRLTYAVESPESWLEDFGRAELIDGSATVRLDPEFAALLTADDFHVFVTPEADCAGLYVSSRSREAFEVREQGNGRASVPFSYRIAARRWDVEARRLERFDVPPPPSPGSAEIPVPAKIPDVAGLPDPGALTRPPLPRPKMPPREAEHDTGSPPSA